MSDAVVMSLINTIGTIVTTALVVVSGKKTRHTFTEQIRDVKKDVKEIREALFVDTAPQEFPARKDRDVTPRAATDRL